MVHTPPIDISNLSSTGYINQALNELERKLGIVTINTTTAELTKMGLLDIIPEASTAAAFVYQGDIYINEDLTVIGKLETACDAVISLPTVSRIHAKIRKKEVNYGIYYK